MEQFRILLLRQYPQVYPAAAALAQRAETFGTIQIEAVFGQLQIPHQVFDSSLPDEVVSEMLAMLTDFASWESISDWFLVHDYVLADHQSMRVSYQHSTPKATVYQGKPMTCQDLWYGTSEDEQEPEQSPEWALRERLVRINLRSVREVETPPNTAAYQTVRISLRKQFQSRSHSVPCANFQFELVQFWDGASVVAIQERMSQGEKPQFTFVTNVLNLPPMNGMSEKDRLLIFTSLLLKIQDFLEFPVCKYQTAKASPTALPVASFRCVSA